MRFFVLFLFSICFLTISCASTESKEENNSRLDSHPISEQEPVDKTSRWISSITRKCEKKDPRSCYIMGAVNYKGKVVDKNLRKAGYYFTKSCEYKYEKACYAIGMMFNSGIGTEKNCEKADHYLSLGCELNHSPSCRQLWECEKTLSREDDFEDEWE